MEKIEECGLYIIKDEYFRAFPSIRHMDNKHENRPYYCAIKDENGCIWMVPISHIVEKYNAKIKKDEEIHGNSVFAYVAKLKGENRAFLTGNVIPVSEQHVKKAFEVNGKPFVIEDRNDIKEIRWRVKRYLALVKTGKLKPAVDILSIAEQL